MTAPNGAVNPPFPWRVSGSYFEACNCDAICPCRKRGDTEGSASTYGHCDFALSWAVKDGAAGDLDLSGLDVVMAGSWFKDGEPWHVALYVDERASSLQQQALADIFLGRAGGGTLRNFASAIGEVYAVRPASIQLDHTENRQRIKVDNVITVRTAGPVPSDEPIYCGIPGYDMPGEELTMEVLSVNDGPLRWEVRGKCGFARSFSYSSDS